MMDFVLVDTSAWICFFIRRGFDDLKRTLSTLIDEDRAVISGPILLELIQELQTSEMKETIKTLTRSIHRLLVYDDHWHKALAMAFDLRRKGIGRSTINTLIAVLAVEYHCLLLHNDSHFDLIARHSSSSFFYNFSLN